MEIDLFLWFLCGCYLLGGISIGYWFNEDKHAPPPKYDVLKQQIYEGAKYSGYYLKFKYILFISIEHNEVVCL